MRHRLLVPVGVAVALALVLLLLPRRDVRRVVVATTPPPPQQQQQQPASSGYLKSLVPMTLAIPSASLRAPPAQLSPWDAELNAHYRGLLRLPSLAQATPLADDMPPPTANASACAAQRCHGHGRCLLPLLDAIGAAADAAAGCECQPGYDPSTDCKSPL